MHYIFSLGTTHNAHKRTTEVVLHGTFIASTILGILLIAYSGIAQSVWFNGRNWIIVLVFIFLALAEFLLRKQLLNAVNWMLIVFYIFLSFCTLVLWGLNAPVGILTISFAITLPSILIGPKAILPVIGISIITLVVVQLIHHFELIIPNIALLSVPSTFWDVIIYSTVLSVFALVSWIAGRQREKNLQRALTAESELRLQKEALKIELEKESASLRLAQLNQIRQLHKFALLGQSTAATLHELSNHLSVLNLDIDDLRQQHSNSTAIANAKDSIDHINMMVRQTRRQLNSYEHKESFNAIVVINQSIKDLKIKFNQKNVRLTKKPTIGRGSFTVHGSSLALMQIVTILLNNALDACCDLPKPEVQVQLQYDSSQLVLSVTDNGSGVDPEIIESLFSPVTSTKSSGLGVGLYIAQHLASNQFRGTVELVESKIGAQFNITIPKQLN